MQRCGGQGGTSTRFFIDQCCQGILQEIPLEMPLNMPEMRNKMSQKNNLPIIDSRHDSGIIENSSDSRLESLAIRCSL